jgi:hypothetical protein
MSLYFCFESFSHYLQPEKLTLVDEEETAEHQSYVREVFDKLENLGRKLVSPSISLSDSYKCKW